MLSLEYCNPLIMLLQSSGDKLTSIASALVMLMTAAFAAQYAAWEPLAGTER